MLAGAVNDTVARESPRIALAPVGTPGTVAGVTAVEAAEAVPVPIALVAVTVKVYEVPFVRPVTMQLVPVLVVQNMEESSTLTTR